MHGRVHVDLFIVQPLEEDAACRCGHQIWSQNVGGVQTSADLGCDETDVTLDPGGPAFFEHGKYNLTFSQQSLLQMFMWFGRSGGIHNIPDSGFSGYNKLIKAKQESSLNNLSTNQICSCKGWHEFDVRLLKAVSPRSVTEIKIRLNLESRRSNQSGVQSHFKCTGPIIPNYTPATNPVTTTSCNNIIQQPPTFSSAR